MTAPRSARIREIVEARSEELIELLQGLVRSAMHAPDEHVPIANLVEACAVYAATLGDLLGYDRGPLTA
jgi:hypothetical protein